MLITPCPINNGTLKNFPLFSIMFDYILHKITQKLRGVGYSIRKIALIIDVSESTVGRWIITEPTIKTRQTRKKIYTNEQILEILEKAKFKGLRQTVFEENLECSKSTLWNYYKSNNITCKKIYPQGASKDLLKKRENFKDTLENVSMYNIISIDESSFYKRLNPLRGWSKKGCRLHVPLQRKQSERYTLLSAISCRGIIKQIVFKGSCNGEIFQKFILSLTADHQYLLLDNVAFHKSISMKNTFREKKFIPILRVSPEWNPIEMYFSIIKAKFRRESLANKVR